MTVGDAKKKAGYNAGIPTGERPKYRKYSSDASKQAQYELSQDAKHSRELHEAEIANRNAKREERKRKEERSRWREDVRESLRRGR